MFVVYRDELGFVKVVVDNNGIQFLDGHAYFGNDEDDYKINMNDVVCVGMDE